MKITNYYKAILFVYIAFTLLVQLDGVDRFNIYAWDDAAKFFFLVLFLVITIVKIAIEADAKEMAKNTVDTSVQKQQINLRKESVQKKQIDLDII